MQGAPKAGPSHHVEIRRRSLCCTSTARSSPRGIGWLPVGSRSGPARRSLIGTACVQATPPVIATTTKTASADPRMGHRGPPSEPRLGAPPRTTSRVRSAKRWLGAAGSAISPLRATGLNLSCESRLQATGPGSPRVRVVTNSDVEVCRKRRCSVGSAPNGGEQGADCRR